MEKNVVLFAKKSLNLSNFQISARQGGQKIIIVVSGCEKDKKGGVK
jgi:hypothetical protein